MTLRRYPSIAHLLTIAMLISLTCVWPPQATAAGMEAANQDDARMEWWREARFGLFIHWGLYAIPAGEWNGETRHAEWIMHTAQIPLPVYEQFVPRFNPVKFDARQWVRIAKDAGMKYIVITSKHHDGFCLFDSELTDYDVMSTPFARDIMAELADACRAEGLRMCWYHSIMDWHHPDYLPRRSWEDRPADDADLDRYVEYLRGQVTELLTNYGPIGVMWFDGEWEGTWNHEYGGPLYDLCRQLQPDVIVNNRVDKGRSGEAGMETGRGHAGDFGTPEQRIPGTGLPGVDWETCMTMNRHWGYNKHDQDWKSTEELIRKLVDIASKGGNFLLNVGPRADGTFPEPSVKRLREMGDWLDVNGQAIYGTSAGPFESLPWGRCTARENGVTTTLYLHVCDWPIDGELVISGLGNNVRGAHLLAEPAADLAVARHGADVHITVPAQAPDSICSVVALEITGRPVVYEMPRIVADAQILVRSLDVELETSSDELDIRYSLDGSDPTVASPKYRGPITITDTTVLRARSFHQGKAVSGAAEAAFTRVDPVPAASPRGLETGLTCAVFEGDWNKLPDFGALTPTSTEPVAGIRLNPGPAVEYVGRRYRGYLQVPEDDVYLFSLTSDDGARLTVAGRVVVDNDGLHSTLEKRGVIALSAGLHPIEVEYFNKTGGAALEVRVASIGEKLKAVPDAALKRPRTNK